MSVWGILLPEATLREEAFAVLSAFVAINTVVYVTLAVAKMLPKVYLSDWVTSANRRSESRSIHPHTGADGPAAGPARDAGHTP